QDLHITLGRRTGSSMRHLRRRFLCIEQRSEKRRATRSSSSKVQQQQSQCRSSTLTRYLFQPNSRAKSLYRSGWVLVRGCTEETAQGRVGIFKPRCLPQASANDT